MRRLTVLAMAVLVAGCGATGSSPATSGSNDEVEVFVTGGAEDPMTPAPDDEVEDIIGGAEDAITQPDPDSGIEFIGPLLSWGSFGGTPPATIFASGGPVAIRSLVRFDEGNYFIEYDVPLFTVGVPAIVATAAGFRDPTDSFNLTTIASANLVTDAYYLTVEVTIVTSLLNEIGGFRLDSIDTIFSLVIFGDVIDLAF